MAGNYDKQVFIAREIFLKFDQKELIEKFQLEQDENYLYLQLLNRMCRIERKTGIIEVSRAVLSSKSGALEMNAETEQRALEIKAKAKAGTLEIKTEAKYEECRDYNTVMTIYDVLCYPKETPVLKGEWCPLANLQVTMSSPSADLFTQKYADAFSGKIPQLWNACEALGGRRPEIMAGADVCWEFDVFPFFPVQLRYWDQDEEFPAQIRLLWDKNALKFMHFETLYYVVHVLLDAVEKGMQEKGDFA